jgi:hypothetical protein
MNENLGDDFFKNKNGNKKSPEIYGSRGFGR